MTNVIVISDLPSRTSKFIPLNINENLSVIRNELEKEDDDTINDTSLFLKRFKTDKDRYAEVPIRRERTMQLNSIIDISNNHHILYIKNSKPNWNYLNKKCKLDYGCTMTFDKIKKAKERAFSMKKCELIIAEVDVKGSYEFKSKEDHMMQKNLFFSVDVDVQKFVKLGMSFEKSKSESTNVEANTSYKYTQYGKAYMWKFELEPTAEFITAVKNAIKSKDAQSFQCITEEFGQFIPTYVTLGGRVHYDKVKMSTGNTAEGSLDVSTNVKAIEIINPINAGYASKSSEEKTKSFSSKCTKLIGGSPPDSLENFDEIAWNHSLKTDYTTWDCIEFKDPVRIFQLLPDVLRDEINNIVGKKILHLAFNDYNFKLTKPGTPQLFKLYIPTDIWNILAKCSIFATVVDTESRSKGFFTCQILYKSGKPHVMIHCIQDSFAERECKLKIGWMIVGYSPKYIILDTDYQLSVLKEDFQANDDVIRKTSLNFEYDPFSIPLYLIGIPVVTSEKNLENFERKSYVIGHHFFNAYKNNIIELCTFCYDTVRKCYVKLPGFTFNLLIITDTNSCEVTRFRTYTSNISAVGNPKFISMATDQEICGAAFLKQSESMIEIKNAACVDKSCAVCKSSLINSKITCTIFDPPAEQE